MRRINRAGLLTVAALLSATTVWACGDKLLAIGRGIRFQRISAAHEANILIYSGSSQPGAALANKNLQKSLARIVHRVQVILGGPQLDEALKSGRVDVVLVDFADLGGVARQLQSAPSKPAIVPILVKPTQAEFAAAQKEYKFALKATADDLEYLVRIDEAMKSRTKAAKS